MGGMDSPLRVGHVEDDMDEGWDGFGQEIKRLRGMDFLGQMARRDHS